ncbi:hypothetical protein L4K53_003038 [Salmonella enterica]|nr:hypothetical protein [Salmonella enterica]
MKLDAGKAADVQGTLDGFNTLAQQLGFRRYTDPGGAVIRRCQRGQYLSYSGIHTGGRPAESD